MGLKQILHILIGWIVFPISFTGWYLDLKYYGLSKNLAEEYLWWHNSEYKELLRLK